MAINLLSLEFTKKDDIVPDAGTIAEIINTGVVNTLAGKDSIIGTASDGSLGSDGPGSTRSPGIPGGVGGPGGFGINNNGTIYRTHLRSFGRSRRIKAE